MLPVGGTDSELVSVVDRVRLGTSESFELLGSLNGDTTCGGDASGGLVSAIVSKFVSGRNQMIRDGMPTICPATMQQQA